MKVKFKTAKLAKGKNFNSQTDYFYTNNKKLKNFYCEQRLEKSNSEVKESKFNDDIFCTAPTQTKLQKWIRKVHNIDVIVECGNNGSKFYKVRIWENGNHNLDYLTSFLTYEKALEAGLQAALKLVK